MGRMREDRLDALLHLLLSELGEVRRGAQVMGAVNLSRSEEMLAHFGVEETNWRDATARDPNFAESETPRFVGRGIAALAADPEKRRFGGRAPASWTLLDEYGFSDVDGCKPHWGHWFRDVLKGELVTPEQV